MLLWFALVLLAVAVAGYRTALGHRLLPILIGFAMVLGGVSIALQEGPWAIGGLLLALMRQKTAGTQPRATCPAGLLQQRNGAPRLHRR